MKYNTYITAKFLKRPNRFIAHCLLENNEKVIAHVPNTGRCGELLIKGTTVFLDYTESKTRKTKYSLYMVKKGSKYINIDSQSPNKIVLEGLLSREIQFQTFKNKEVIITPEYTYGNSRFDFLIESKQEKMLIEVKGVSLEEDGIVKFPDAPSIRAVKHVEELIKAREDGYMSTVIFLVQMEHPIKKFIPNVISQIEIQRVLVKAEKKGVDIRAYSSIINKNEIILGKTVNIELT